MEGTGRTRIGRARVRRSLSALLLALLVGVLSAPTAHADTIADLSVQLTGPVTAPGNGPFTYLVQVADLGPDPADGAALQLDLPAGAIGVAASCTASVGGAACPATLTVAAGHVTATIASLPPAGSVTVTVTGQFGAGSSATATASVSASTGVVDPDPTNDASTLTTTLSPTTADVSVTTTVDVTTAAFGQTVTYSSQVTNHGPSDVVGLGLDGRILSLHVGPQNPLTLTGTISCASSAADAAACPAGLATPAPYSDVLNGSSAPLSLPQVDIPAGRTLYLTVAVAFTTTHCSTLDTREVQTSVDLIAPNQALLTGTLTALSPVVTLGPCTGLSIRTTLSTPTTAPGQALTATVTVANDGTVSTAVPFAVELPDRGGLTLDPLAAATCATTGPVPCPPDLAYDRAARRLTGTVAALAAGESYTLTLHGRAGLVAGTYGVTSSLVDPHGDVGSTSRATFQLVNTQAQVSAAVSLSGGVSPSALTFTGSLACAQQGTTSFTVTIPAGQARSTVRVGRPLWLHDVCSATLLHVPQAPEGYAWSSRPSAPVTVRLVSGPATASFALAMTRTATPTPTPTTSTPSAPPSAQTETASPTSPSSSQPSVTSRVSVVVGTASTVTSWALAALGALVTAAGLGLATGRL